MLLISPVMLVVVGMLLCLYGLVSLIICLFRGVGYAAVMRKKNSQGAVVPGAPQCDYQARWEHPASGGIYMRMLLVGPG